jgi:hypothetical protein
MYLPSCDKTVQTDVRILIGMTGSPTGPTGYTLKSLVLRWVESDSYVDPSISKPAAIFCQIDGNLDLRLNALEMRVTAGSSAQALLHHDKGKETQESLDISRLLEKIRTD